jgi:alkyldihydroxyacetonephosphate synthase
MTEITIDTVSLLVDVSGAHTLDDLETELSASGFTLALTEVEPHATVADWLAKGAPGARSAFMDPVDHLVAGLSATLASGRKLVVRPCPRRAVGPDLIALLVGTQGQLGRVDRAWLRIHPRVGRRPTLPAPHVDLDPPVTEGEARLFEAIRRELLDDSLRTD